MLFWIFEYKSNIQQTDKNILCQHLLMSNNVALLLDDVIITVWNGKLCLAFKHLYSLTLSKFFEFLGIISLSEKEKGLKVMLQT